VGAEDAEEDAEEKGCNPVSLADIVVVENFHGINYYLWVFPG
jgi:hypothetical protein